MNRYEDTDSRAVSLGQYIAQTGTTVRKAAQIFGISKSTVHKDVSERLQDIDPDLYDEVKKILEINKAERHVRGGLATRRKYKALSEK